MSTLLGLAGIIIVCWVCMWVFSPKYGVCRGCSGCALQTVMEEDKRKRATCSKRDGVKR